MAFLKYAFDTNHAPYGMKHYNRNQMTAESFKNSIRDFISSLIPNLGVKKLSKNLDSKKLEFYVMIMVDKKLSKHLLRQSEKKRMMYTFYNVIDNYTQIKFMQIIKIPEIDLIMRTLLSEPHISEIFQKFEVLKNNQEKYTEALDKLRSILDS